jgi:hypothetical protein
MRWSKLLPLALAMMLVACAPRELTRQERAVEEQMLQGRVDLWEKSLNTLKPDSMALTYEQSADFSAAWPSGTRTRGWEQEAQAQKDFVARTSAFNFDLQEPVIEVLSPSIAVVTFRYAADVADSLTKERALFSGQGTMVWRKDPADKTWKIHTVQTSRSPQPAQPTGARRR